MGIATSSPVTTATKEGTAYLELVPHGNKVRVQRTAAGKTLNKFWTVWLRQLILANADPKYGFGVELRGTSLLISSSTTAAGRMETVRAFAQKIVPVPSPPITRWDSHTSSRYAQWRVADGVDLEEMVQTISLPRGARLQGGAWTLSLHRKQDCQFRISELCLMVELHVALHCCS